MDFYVILDQVIALLQQRGKASYRALKLQFTLDDASLDVLKDELINVHQLARDHDGEMLVWTGATATAQAVVSPPAQPPPPPAAQEQHAPLVEPRPPAPPPGAERRQLTVMFCDVVDSTRLSSQLDPEEYRDVVRAYHAACTEVIQRFDGHVAQLLGDGLLVYFGYPQAHDDDAQRAVRTGLGILAAVGNLHQALQHAKGIQLAIRIGVHTGPVVVGDMGGLGHQEQLALGEVPNIAARIEGLAEANTVAISDASYRLVQGYFACQALGAQTLRGVAAPVQVYRVLQDSGARGRLDVAVTRGLTPLVGREAEVTLLLERWEQVKAGAGHVVLLSGEGGIGKSRLVHVLKDHVATESHVRWECRSVPYYQHTALYPVTDLFQRTLQWHPDETPDQQLGKLEQTLRLYRLPLEETVPLFASLLSLPIPEDRYPPLHVSPQRQRQQTLETIVSILQELAEQQPVLFVVEDLHWTDPTTLELLNLVIDQTPTASLLVLLTCRPPFQPSWHHRSYITEMTLNHVSHAQVAQMVTGVADGKTFPAAVLQQIVAKADGVPLFVEEITKALLESGQLTARERHYALVGPLSTLTIPATLQDALMARLDRLVTAKGIAQIGATIGRQFSYALLQALALVEAATLQQELGRLVEAELVYQRGLPPQATYTFKHALMQDAAYESLLRSTRQHYHQRIAQALAEHFPETTATQPEVLAQHYSAAGLHAQALPYWQHAGQRALARSAHREAIAALERGLEAIPHLPHTRTTLEQAIDLRLALRTALNVGNVSRSDFGRTLSYLREAEALAATLDDPHRLAEVSLFLSRHCSFMGAHDHAMAAAQRALTLTPAGGDISLRARANQRLGMIALWQGNYPQAIDCFGQTMALLDGAQRSERFGTTTIVAASTCAWLAWCYAEVGLFPAGTASGEEGQQIAEAVNHPASLLVALWGSGVLALRQGHLSRALALLERAMAICRDADFPAFLPRVTAALGAAYALAGRVADAVTLCPPTLDQTMGTDMVEFQTLSRLAFGETHLVASHLGEASTVAEGALALAREHHERGHQAYALRLLGDIAAQGNPPEVEQTAAYYQQALALSEELGMRPLQAHCHRGLGTLYAATAQREQARTELSTAIEMYTSMEMTFWLPQTEAALAQVEGR